MDSPTFPVPNSNENLNELGRLIGIIRANCPGDPSRCPMIDGSCETCFSMLLDEVVLNKLADGARNRKQYLEEEWQVDE